MFGAQTLSLFFGKDETGRRGWCRFASDSIGQDLAEYCLITALISLIAMGIIWHVSGGLQGSWGTANTTLNSTNSSVTQSTGVATQ